MHDKDYDRIYCGYQFLMGGLIFLWEISGIFTYHIRLILRFTCIILGIAVLCGLIGAADKLRRQGYQKAKLWQKLLLLPLLLLMGWLHISTFIPSVIKSLLAVALLTAALFIIKPKRKEDLK